MSRENHYHHNFYSESVYFQQEDAARREQNLEDAKKIVIKEDESLPKAKQVRSSPNL